MNCHATSSNKLFSSYLLVFTAGNPHPVFDFDFLQYLALSWSTFWQLSQHSSCHPIWHPMWNSILQSICQPMRHSTSLVSWHLIWHLMSRSIWHSYHSFRNFICLAFVLSIRFTIYLTFIWHSTHRFAWHLFWHLVRHFRWYYTWHSIWNLAFSLDVKVTHFHIWVWILSGILLTLRLILAK